MVEQDDERQTGQSVMRREDHIRRALFESNLNIGGTLPEEVMVKNPTDRVALWNTVTQRKLTGRSAPMRCKLPAYLATHPEYVLYVGQSHRTKEVVPHQLDLSSSPHASRNVHCRRKETSPGYYRALQEARYGRCASPSSWRLEAGSCRRPLSQHQTKETVPQQQGVIQDESVKQRPKDNGSQSGGVAEDQQEGTGTKQEADEKMRLMEEVETLFGPGLDTLGLVVENISSTPVDVVQEALDLPLEESTAFLQDATMASLLQSNPLGNESPCPQSLAGLGQGSQYVSSWEMDWASESQLRLLQLLPGNLQCGFLEREAPALTHLEGSNGLFSAMGLENTFQCSTHESLAGRVVAAGNVPLLSNLVQTDCWSAQDQLVGQQQAWPPPLQDFVGTLPPLEALQVSSQFCSDNPLLLCPLVQSEARSFHPAASDKVLNFNTEAEVHRLRVDLTTSSSSPPVAPLTPGTRPACSPPWCNLAQERVPDERGTADERESQNTAVLPDYEVKKRPCHPETGDDDGQPPREYSRLSVTSQELVLPREAEKPGSTELGDSVAEPETPTASVPRRVLQLASSSPLPPTMDSALATDEELFPPLAGLIDLAAEEVNIREVLIDPEGHEAPPAFGGKTKPWTLHRPQPNVLLRQSERLVKRAKLEADKPAWSPQFSPGRALDPFMDSPSRDTPSLDNGAGDHLALGTGQQQVAAPTLVEGGGPEASALRGGPLKGLGCTSPGQGLTGAEQRTRHHGKARKRGRQARKLLDAARQAAQIPARAAGAIPKLKCPLKGAAMGKRPPKKARKLVASLYANAPTGYVGSAAPTKATEVLFEKVLTSSDTGHLGRIILPKSSAEEFLPAVDDKDGMRLIVEDSQGGRWCCHYRWWPNNKSRMYVLEHAGHYIKAFGLLAGDTIRFCRSASGHMIVQEKRQPGRAGRRREVQIPTPPRVVHSEVNSRGRSSLEGSDESGQQETSGDSWSPGDSSNVSKHGSDSEAPSADSMLSESDSPPQGPGSLLEAMVSARAASAEDGPLDLATSLSVKPSRDKVQQEDPSIGRQALPPTPYCAANLDNCMATGTCLQDPLARAYPLTSPPATPL